MKVFVKGMGEITLEQGDFVAEGGEARVYAQGDWAYKLYHKPARAIAAGKIAELGAITDRNVITPVRLVLEAASGKPLGYSMRFVRDAYPLCQLFTRAFREQHGLGPGAAFALVRCLRELVAHVHEAGVLIVDLNELNVLVDRSLTVTYAIDADSYQTPSFPATAISPNVCDPSARGAWSELSDWFSFAVVTFQLLVGIHPYKGNHPTVKGLEARMAEHLSVFDRAVSVPRVCYGVDVIPEPFRSWYRAVLQDGKRLLPPAEGGGAILVMTPRALVSGAAVAIRELARVTGKILAAYESNGRLVVCTDQDLWLDGRSLGLCPRGQLALSFSPRMNRPVLAWLNDELGLRDLDAGTDLALAVRADELTSAAGRIIVRSADKIVELVLSEVGTATIVSPRLLANVLEHATRLYDGLAVQNVLGAAFVLLFPEQGSCYQVRVPELDGAKVVTAKIDGRVLMLLCAQGGRYERLVLRFDPSFTSYDLRRVADVSPTGLNFVTLDSGVCVCLNEEDEIEVFAERAGSTGMRTVRDAALGGDLLLTHHGGRVAFVRAGGLYGMTLR